MMSLNDSILIYDLKNKATCFIKNYQPLSSLSLKDIGICLRDGTFKTDIGLVNLHPTRKTYWVTYINENFFDSYYCVCPKKLSRVILKQNGYCLYSENKIQSLSSKIDSYCAALCNLLDKSLRNRL